MLKRIFQKRKYLFLATAMTVMLLLIGVFTHKRNQGEYPNSSQWDTYQGGVVFDYPASWKISDCSNEQPFIELPGGIKDVDDKAKNLKIYGDAGIYSSRPCDVSEEALDLSEYNREACSAEENGEALGNGLKIGWDEPSSNPGTIQLVKIQQVTCKNDLSQVLFTFSFDNSYHRNGLADSVRESTAPRVAKETFLSSPQYQDIKRFAESIRPKQ